MNTELLDWSLGIDFIDINGTHQAKFLYRLCSNNLCKNVVVVTYGKPTRETLFLVSDNGKFLQDIASHTIRGKIVNNTSRVVSDHSELDTRISNLLEILKAVENWIETYDVPTDIDGAEFWLPQLRAAIADAK